jgi:hypothetical protein
MSQAKNGPGLGFGKLVEPRPAVAERLAALDKEIEKWRMTFETGDDYFDNLDGIDPFTRVSLPGPARDKAERRYHRAARVAWQRLGRRFMATRQPGH